MGIPLLRDPESQFVDRLAEKRTISEFCEGRLGADNRCLLLRTKAETGLTYFLRHIESTMGSSWFPVYADCRSSDPETIFRRFFDKVEQRKVLRWRTLSVFRELGESFIRLLAPFLLPAPVGAALGPFSASLLPKVGTTPYASVPSERFSKLVTSGRWKQPILFLIDNAQDVQPASLNILSTVYASQYDHVRFVLSFVSDAASVGVYERFVERLKSLGLGLVTRDFPPPDDQLVSELASFLNRPLPPDKRADFLRASNGSVVRLVAALTGEPAAEAALTVTEKEILRFLLLAEQPVRRDDLFKIVLESSRVGAPTSAIAKAVDALLRKGLITVIGRRHLGDEIEVAAGQEHAVRELVADPVASAAAANELYRYFAAVARVHSPNHSESAYAALLYKLSKQVDPVSTTSRAFDLVRISLKQGDLTAAKHYIEHAIGAAPARFTADLYALLAFHVSIQEYDRALEILEQLGPSYWSNLRVLRIIHAIARNRVRQHTDANQEIDGLLAEPEATPEEFALLTSYKVAGLLHEGRLEEARAVFESSRDRFRSARNRGYALRNCAAVYFWGPARDLARADDILIEAIEAFRRDNDHFGQSTVINNRGALIGSSAARRESAVRALPLFEESFRTLTIFGTHHLEEAGANLGIALFLAGKIDEAITHLGKVSPIASFDFPKVLMESALALAELIRGDAALGRVRMHNLASAAHALALPEAVYRGYVNAAALESAVGGAANRFEFYVEKARQTGFWAGTQSLDRVIAGHHAAAISPETLPDYFSYDYFQYWSQNPLSVVAAPLLPEQAIRDDVIH